MLFNPALVAIAGLLFWVFLRITSPLDYRLEMQWNTIIFIALGYGSFLAGCMLAAQSKQSKLANKANGRNVWVSGVNMNLFWVCFGIGLLSMALRLYDRIIVRGVDYFGDSAEVRDTLANTNFSGASAVSSLILPFCFLPMILLLAGKWESRYKFHAGLALILFMLPTLESVAQASRSIMLLTIALGFATVSILRFGGRIADRKLVIPVLATAAGLLILSTSIFQTRLNDAGRQLQDSLQDSVYAEAYFPNRKAVEEMGNPNSPLGDFYTTLLPNQMYYLSGLYEFEMQFNRPDEQFFGFGSYIFYPYSRVISIVFNVDNIRGLDESVLLYRYGVFTSFFGPIWVDFGWFSILIIGLIGFLSERLSQFVRQGYINALPLYLFLVVVIFYMPVFNFLVIGFGFFIFHGFALFALFSSFQPRHQLSFEQRKAMLG